MLPANCSSAAILLLFSFWCSLSGAPHLFNNKGVPRKNQFSDGSWTLDGRGLENLKNNGRLTRSLAENLLRPGLVFKMTPFGTM